MSDLIQTGPYQPQQSSPPRQPERIGRYRIDRVLGKGGARVFQTSRLTREGGGEPGRIGAFANPGEGSLLSGR